MGAKLKHTNHQERTTLMPSWIEHVKYQKSLHMHFIGVGQKTIIYTYLIFTHITHNIFDHVVNYISNWDKLILLIRPRWGRYSIVFFLLLWMLLGRYSSLRVFAPIFKMINSLVQELLRTETQWYNVRTQFSSYKK